MAGERRLAEVVEQREKPIEEGAKAETASGSAGGSAAVAVRPWPPPPRRCRSSLGFVQRRSASAQLLVTVARRWAGECHPPPSSHGVDKRWGGMRRVTVAAAESLTLGSLTYPVLLSALRHLARSPPVAHAVESCPVRVVLRVTLVACACVVHLVTAAVLSVIQLSSAAPMSNVEAADAVDTEAVEAVASEEAAEEGDEVQPEESTQQVEEPAEKVVVEAEGAEQLATVLSVDTREEDEGGEAIAASEPILPSSSGPSDQPAAPPSLAYGSIHHWCPRCIRQQQLPDCTASDDPLALTWSEQAFFACGASHLSSLIDAPGFLPPPTSLPPFVPTTIAIVGPPLSGRTTLALQLASTYNLAYISLPSLLTSLTSPTHPLHSTLPTLPHPAPLPVLLSLLSHAITTAAASGLSGYVLDSWPSTVEVWRAMEERGMGVRRVIRTVAGLRVEEEVALVEVKTKVRQDTLDAEQAKRQRMKAASAAAAALIEARRLSQAAGDADLQGGGKEAAAEDAQVSLEATLEAAASAEDTAAAETDEPSTSAADKSAPPVVRCRGRCQGESGFDNAAAERAGE